MLTTASRKKAVIDELGKRNMTSVELREFIAEHGGDIYISYQLLRIQG